MKKKHLDIDVILLANAVVYLIAIPFGINSSYFYLVNGIIILVNLFTLIILIKNKQAYKAFLFFVITLLFKPLSLFYPVFSDTSITNLSLSVLLFIFTLSFQ